MMEQRLNGFRRQRKEVRLADPTFQHHLPLRVFFGGMVAFGAI
jgi:hypothetical protein